MLGLGPTKLARLKGKHAGQCVFVLGNGPSIVSLPLQQLKGRHVIGMNGSVLLDGQHGFVSEYYVVSDARFICHPTKYQWATSLVHPSTVRVFRQELMYHDDPALKESTHYIPSLGKNGFSHDLERGFYFGCTTSMLALQLAHYLGFSRIYLLGHDFDYRAKSKRFYDEDVPSPVDAFLSVQLWNLQNARRELASRGVSLQTCSENSRLGLYVPYSSFEEALEFSVRSTGETR